MYYMDGVSTPSEVSLRNLIASNPARALETFNRLYWDFNHKIGSPFLTAFRSSLGATNKKMYLDYLHRELIPSVFPEQLNKFAKQEDLDNCLNEADTWNNYLDLVNRKILDRAQIIMETLSQFLELDFKHDNAEHVNQFIDLMENIQVFSGFNTALKVLFKLLKLIPKKLKESSSSILKNNVIATLNSNVTKGTIWKMMKKELGEFLDLDWRITDPSSRTYNQEDFLLHEQGLVFNPSEIDIHGTRAQGESASMESYIFKLLKLIPKKLKESSSSILKNKVIATLNSNVTQGTIWKMMKKELGEFLDLDWRITDPSSRTYNQEDFLLHEQGLVFNPSEIDIHGTRAQGESASMQPYIVRDSRNNESRFGCPASFQDLEMLINHMEKIVNWVPDDKFRKWMQAV